MAVVYSLVQTIIHLSSVIPISPWETCVLDLIEKNQPTSVYFLCLTSSVCPSEDFYKQIRIPSQTIHDTSTDKLPQLKKSDLVFLLAHEEVVTWSNETIQRYRLGGKNNFKFVIIANKNQDINHDLGYMGGLFQAMWKAGLVYSAVLLKNDISTEMYTFIPFRSSESCEDTSPIKLGECAKAAVRVFDPLHKTQNLNNCTIRISFIDEPLFLAGFFVGRYSHLFMELGKRMNFNFKKVISKDTRNYEMCGPDELIGIKSDVVSGEAHMAAGTFNNKECSQLEYIAVPYIQCTSWCTPILPGSADILDFLLGQLDKEVWIALAGITLILIMSVAIMHLFSRDSFSVSDASYLALAIFTPVPTQFRGNCVRLVVAIWLSACLVIRTAYEAESKCRSTVPIASRIIEDLEQLADSNLKLYTMRATKPMLQYDDRPMGQWINENTQIWNGPKSQIITVLATKTVAFFTYDLRCGTISGLLSKDFPVLYPYAGGCYLTNQVLPIVTLPGLPFNERFKELLLRFSDTGLAQKWFQIDPPRRSQGTRAPYSLAHVLPFLYFLCIGHIIACVAFLMENAFYWWPYLPDRVYRPRAE